MRIVGIDGATRKTGVSLFEDKKLIEHRVIDFSRMKDIDKRMCEMMLSIEAFLNEFKPDVIACEDTWSKANKFEKRNPKTDKMLARLGGAIWFWAISNQTDIHFLTPSCWRSAVGIKTGPGINRDMLKSQAIEKIEKDYGFTATDDEAEAILIGASMPILLSSDDDDELFE